MAYLEPWVTIAPEVPDEVAVLLRDAQTSGGLLLASASPDLLVAELTRRGTLAAVIGHVTAGEAGHIAVNRLTGPAVLGVTGVTVRRSGRTLRP